MNLTPLRQIRKKCLDCSLEQKQEVKDCPMKDCALYPYRMGRNPKPDEEKAYLKAVKKANETKKKRLSHGQD